MHSEIDLFSDYAGLRLAGQDTDIYKKLDEIEKEMISLYPVNHLFHSNQSTPQIKAQLADIDFALKSSGTYTEAELRRILLHLSAESMPLGKEIENLCLVVSLKSSELNF